MNYLAGLRAERESIGVSLDVLASLAGVSTSSLSRFERKLQTPSDAAVRTIQAAMTSLQHLRMRYDKLPLNLDDIEWLRAEIGKMNGGKDAAAIKTAGEASSSARAKRLRPTSGKSRRASAK